MPQPGQWDEDTNQPTWASAIATVSGTAGGTYTATEQGIINNLVTAVNALVNAVKAAGIVQQD